MEEITVEDCNKDGGDHMLQLLYLSSGEHIIGTVSESDLDQYIDEKINNLTIYDAYMVHYVPNGACLHTFMELSDDDFFNIHRQHILTTAYPNRITEDAYFKHIEDCEIQYQQILLLEEKAKKDQQELVDIINEPSESDDVLYRSHRTNKTPRPKRLR